MDLFIFKDKLLNDKNISNTIDNDEMVSILRASYRTVASNLNKEGILNLLICMEEFNELAEVLNGRYLKSDLDFTYELLEELADSYLSIEYIKDICHITKEDLISKEVSVKTIGDEEYCSLERPCYVLANMGKQLSKYIRGKDNYSDLAQAIVDTKFVLDDIVYRYCVDEKAVNRAINIKLERQHNRNNEATF